MEQNYSGILPLKQTRSKPTNEISENWSGARFLKFLGVTFLFAVFCGMAIVGMWYFSSFFKNDSYKMVVFFLVLIGVSNVAAKYLIWSMEY